MSYSIVYTCDGCGENVQDHIDLIDLTVSCLPGPAVMMNAHKLDRCIEGAFRRAQAEVLEQFKAQRLKEKLKKGPPYGSEND